MLKPIILCFFTAFFIFSCGSKKDVVSKEPEKKDIFINTQDDVTIAGAVNFEDEESLSIYSAILKNVIGDKPGAYIGNQMDKLAVTLDGEMSYSELLRAGEGLILEFNTNSDLYFDTGKTTLNQSSKEVLDILANTLEKFPKINVIIETHTDNSGDDEVNMKMTNERVSSIESYLLGHGLDKSRLKIKAFGENQPKYKNDTSENRAKNRRVEFGFYASEALKEEARNMTD
jgi:outer membrane protein OmpA-like peptidoglycan-associated protein